MLISKNESAVAVADIVTLRLVSGEEIVGKVTAIDATSVTITKPIHILAMMTPQGAQVQFAPFLFSVLEDSGFRFEFSKLVLNPIKTGPDIKKNYIAATSPIVQPNAPGLLVP